MPKYSEQLGEVVKSARAKTAYTQAHVAELSGIDNRTVLNIENNKGNPKLEVLYPLIRTLQIDPTEIFYPETQRNSPALNQLRIIIEGCSEEDNKPHKSHDSYAVRGLSVRHGCHHEACKKTRIACC